MRFVAEIMTIGGGLPDFLGASCSSSLHVHVSSSERCEEVAFGGSLTVAVVATVLVDFLAVCEVSIEMCLLVSLFPGSHRPGPLVLFIARLFPACALDFRKVFSPFSVTA
jgi:hypothetical protein